MIHIIYAFKFANSRESASSSAKCCFNEVICDFISTIIFSLHSNTLSKFYMYYDNSDLGFEMFYNISMSSFTFSIRLSMWLLWFFISSSYSFIICSIKFWCNNSFSCLIVSLLLTGSEEIMFVLKVGDKSLSISSPYYSFVDFISCYIILAWFVIF